MIKLLNAGLYPVKNPKFNVGKDAGIDFYCPAYNEKFFSILKDKSQKWDSTNVIILIERKSITHCFILEVL